MLIKRQKHNLTLGIAAASYLGSYDLGISHLIAHRPPRKYECVDK